MGPIRCRDISLHRHIQPYFSHLFQERQLQIASAKRYASALRSFFRFLEIEDVVETDPTARLQLPRVRKTERHFLTPDKFRSFVSCIDVPIVRYVAFSQAFAGLRVSEAIQLTVTDVFMSSTARATRHGRSRSTRNWSHRCLQEYLQHHRPATSSLLFFATKRTGTISIPYINLVFERAAKRAGFDKPVTSHILRHSYASWLVKHGISIVHIQKILGHESVWTTSTYMHVHQDDLHVALEHVRFFPEKGGTLDE